jgi:hypothetical protein
MRAKETSPDGYISKLAPVRKMAMKELRKVILNNLPLGFAEVMSYGMLSYVVPHSLYAPGYHADPKQPLPFISLASQKNYIALYHMGLYADQRLLSWFKTEYSSQCKTKLDMGKTCIRFKSVDEIPFGLIGALASKITVKDWIDKYEAGRVSNAKK